MTNAVERNVAWQSVLEGTGAEGARRIAGEVATWAEALGSSPMVGLKGDGSLALLLAACERPSAADRLETALVSTLAAPATISLFGGLAGASWLLRQLADGDEVAAALARFDQALLRHLDVPRWEERHDLMSGLAGVGVMAADRSDPAAAQLAERVLFHLETTATLTDAGAFWRTSPRFLPERLRRQYPDGLIDMGVAHGVGGVIGMLAQFVAAGIEPVRSRRLLASASAWLIDMLHGGSSQFYTTWPLDVPRPKRLGWCNGYSGVAGVLLRAGRALGDAAIETTALGLLRGGASPTAIDGSLDAGFCHGAAGIAQIYRAAHALTGEPSLAEAARRWIDETMRLRVEGAGSAGYRYVRIDEERPRWGDDASLLSGVTGTALVLLSACEPREPEWQRLFVV